MDDSVIFVYGKMDDNVRFVLDNRDEEKIQYEHKKHTRTYGSVLTDANRRK